MDTAHTRRPGVPTTVLASRVRAIFMCQNTVKIFVENGNDLLKLIEEAKTNLAVDCPAK
ncbi:hypothetical protein STEG23_026067, partial [Scotinomys teguina]